jgi:hypothetical protein
MWHRRFAEFGWIAGSAWLRGKTRTVLSARPQLSGTGSAAVDKKIADKKIDRPSVSKGPSFCPQSFCPFPSKSGVLAGAAPRRVLPQAAWARRTSRPRENAIAGRSGQSERRRESDRPANGAISGPGVSRRTTASPGRAESRQPSRWTQPRLRSNILFVAPVRRRASVFGRPSPVRSAVILPQGRSGGNLFFCIGVAPGIPGVRVHRWDDRVSPEEPHVFFAVPGMR